MTEEGAASIVLTVPADGRYGHVVALVLGGLGSRLDLPLDRIDELQVAAARVLACGARGDTVTLGATVSAVGLSLRLGPVAATGLADRSFLLVLEALVDAVSIEEEDGVASVVLDVRPPSRGT